MSSLPGVSNLDAATQTFPVLTEGQINRIRVLGKLRKVERGEILFKPNDISVPFFVLLSGSLEIVQLELTGERLITKHESRSFTGELSMISGQKCMVLGRVSNAGEFLEVSPEGLRTLVARDAGLSEIIMRAFILRRLALITHRLGNVILMGLAALRGHAAFAGVSWPQWASLQLR